MVKPLLLFFSVFVLVRGHDEPGGGFVGGLLAGSAWVLHSIAFGAGSARESMRLRPRTLIGAGLLLALLTAVLPLAFGQPFFQANWMTVEVSGEGPTKVGTPMLFDLGVYLVVLGVVTGMVLTLAEE